VTDGYRLFRKDGEKGELQTTGKSLTFAGPGVHGGFEPQRYLLVYIDNS